MRMTNLVERNKDIVTDLANALPGNGSVNTFPRIRQCYATR
jgi:hypothetical protein